MINSALITGYKLYCRVHSHRKQQFKLYKIFHYFYCIFDQINADLLRKRDFQKHLTVNSIEGIIHALIIVLLSDFCRCLP